MLNNLECSFKAAIENLQLLNGRLIVLDSFMQKGIAGIEADKMAGNELFGSGLPFRDLTLKPGTNNLFMSDETYKVDRDHLSDEVNMILSRESFFQFVEAYEILESFLYDQIAEFINLNKLAQIPDKFKGFKNYNTIRDELKRMKNRNGNKHLLKILRDNNDVFKFHETKNIYEIDFEDWYHMISEVRHSVIHSRMAPNPHLKDLLPNAYFDEYFEIKILNNSNHLVTTVDKIKELLHRIAGYVFFVYKAVSEVSFVVNTNFKTIQHILSDPYYK